MEEAVLIKKLKEQLERAYQLPFYRKRFDQAGFNPKELKNLNDFSKLPFIIREDQGASLEESPPLGSLFHSETVLITHTPAPVVGLLPEYHTKNDLQHYARAMADSLKLAGVTSEDIVQLTLSYAPVVGSWAFHDALQEVGAKVVNAGPGETQRQVEFMQKLGTTVLVCFPSFALKLASSGAPAPRIIICAGEPFTSIDGYRERVKRAFGDNTIVAIDAYGTSGFSVIAMECVHQMGMHIIEDYVYVEVIDPETGNLLEDGQYGELVLTHLNKEAMPLVRFRTGDLSEKKIIECKCGKKLSLPKGVFGRTTEMYRIKGIKVYPSSIGFVLASIQGVSPRDYRLYIQRKEGETDRLRIEIKGDPQVANVEEIRDKLTKRLIVRPDEVKVVEDLEPGPVVVDQRGGIDR